MALTDILPKLKIEKVKISKFSEEKSHADVVIFIEEESKDEINGTWITDEELMKYLSLEVVQIQDGKSESRREYVRKLLELSTGTTDTILKNFRLTNNAGEQTYQVPVVVRFEFENSLENLYYTATPFLVIDEIARELKVEVFEVDTKEIRGGTSTQIVIDEGEVKSSRYKFETSEGEEWLEPVHLDRGKIKTGYKASLDAQEVQVVEEPNEAIEDKRPLEVKQVRDSFKGVESDKFDQIDWNVKKELSKNYFGDLMISRKENGSFRVFFSLDFWDLIKDNSLFSFIFDNLTKTEVFDFLEGAKIHQMKFSRERVRRNKEFLFDRNKEPEIIEDIKEIDIYDGNAFELGIRHFEINDASISRKTDGFYRYRVEMKIEDPTVKFVHEQIGILEDHNLAMNEYLSNAEVEYNYNVDRIQTTLVERLELSGIEQLIEQVISDYLRIRRIFGIEIGDVNIETTLKTILSPRAATLDGIEGFVKSIEEVRQYLEYNSNFALGTSYSVSNSQTSQAFVQRPKKTRSLMRFIEKEKIFNEIVNANVQKNVGTKYFKEEDVVFLQDYLAKVRIDNDLMKIDQASIDKAIPMRVDVGSFNLEFVDDNLGVKVESKEGVDKLPEKIAKVNKFSRKSTEKVENALIEKKESIFEDEGVLFQVEAPDSFERQKIKISDIVAESKDISETKKSNIIEKSENQKIDVKEVERREILKREITNLRLSK